MLKIRRPTPSKSQKSLKIKTFIYNFSIMPKSGGGGGGGRALMFGLDFHRYLGSALAVGREGGYNVYHRFQALDRLDFHRYLGSSYFLNSG